MYTCPKCNKQYKSPSGKWYHTQNDRECYPVPPPTRRYRKRGCQNKPVAIHDIFATEACKVHIKLTRNDAKELDQWDQWDLPEDVDNQPNWQLAWAALAGVHMPRVGADSDGVAHGLRFEANVVPAVRVLDFHTEEIADEVEEWVRS